MKYILFFALTLSVSAFAGITENQIDFKIEATKISLTPKSGFHLNKDAPASAVIDNLESMNKPATKTEKLFVFTKDAKAKKAVLSFYVCDDKLTVCEMHDKTLDLKSGAVKSAPAKTSYNNIKDLNLKSVNGKPTLLVFSAPWCPACIRMMTETYHTPPVEKQLVKLNFIKLNSDLPENNELAEKFHLKAIPTLILLDKEGNETHRWLDFQTAKVFAKELDSELKKVDSAASIAENAKLGDPAAARVLAYKYYNSMDFAEAYKWFSLTTSAQDQKYKLASEVSLAAEKADEDAKLTGEYLAALEKGIILSSSKLDQIRWTIDYLDKKAELKQFNPESQAKAAAVVKDLDLLIKNPKAAKTAFAESTYGDYTGFEKAELLWMKAKIAEDMSDKKLEDETKAQSVALLSKMKLSINRPGEMLMAIGYLKEAGNVDLVDKLFNQLIQKYPTSYVYFEKYARFAEKNKNNEKALQLVSEALKYPEGNVPQLSLLKAQILADLNKKTEALQTVDEALSYEGIGHRRYGATVHKLNSLKKELTEKSVD
jgi:thiol-disulfide isomerase/thioredoxin